MPLISVQNIIPALQIDQMSLHKVALDQDFPDHIVPQIQIQFQPLFQRYLLGVSLTDRVQLESVV